MRSIILCIMTQEYATVVILGAGISGYYAFQTLQKTLLPLNTSYSILLIDRKPYSQFLPIMHQIVSRRICPTTARALFTDIQSKRAHTLQASVERIDPIKKFVHTTKGDIHFDTLIVALGSELHYYNTPGAREYTYRVNDLDEALRLRNALDKITQTQEAKTITIVGGSYTGVEVAGEVASRLKQCPQHTIQLVDGRQTILATMTLQAQKLATRRLKNLRVHIRTNARVQSITSKSITLQGNEELISHITIWAGGCKNTGGTFFPDCEQNNDRVSVDEYLRVGHMQHIFAIGDIAAAHNKEGGRSFPQNGSIAHEQARYVGKHIGKIYRSLRQTKPFSHKTANTTVMSVGSWYGIFTYKSITIGGIVPWLIRQAVYILFLPTKKNKWRFLREFWTGV